MEKTFRALSFLTPGETSRVGRWHLARLPMREMLPGVDGIIQDVMFLRGWPGEGVLPVTVYLDDIRFVKSVR